jgi:Flp pilus assembly protein TadD
MNTEIRDSFPSVELYCEQGRRLASAGDLARATRVFQVACIRFPLEPAPWIGLGLCLKKLGKVGPAELALSTAEALGSGNAGVLVHRAECQLRLGDPGAARRDLLRASSEALRQNDRRTADRARRGLEWLDDRAAPGDVPGAEEVSP